MRKSELVGLKAEIATSAATGRSIRTAIGAARDRARYDLWVEKRAHGADTRVLLLAYAFLRGVPYRDVEPTAVAPQGRTAKGWRGDLAQCVSSIASHAAGGVIASETVGTWLDVPEASARRARRADAIQRSVVHRDVRRARFVRGAA